MFLDLENRYVSTYEHDLGVSLQHYILYRIRYYFHSNTTTYIT